MDEEAAFRELDEIDRKHLEENVEIRDLLENIEKIHKTYKIGEYEFKIRAGVSKKMKRKIQEAARLAETTPQLNEDGTLSKEGEELVNRVEWKTFEILSDLCIDPPFDDPKSWALLEERSGMVDEIFLGIMTIITGGNEAVEKFRKDR